MTRLRTKRPASPPLSIEDIVAAVRRPSSIVEAEQALAALRGRRDRLADEAAALSALCSPGVFGGPAVQDAREAENAKRHVDQQITVARKALDGVRAAYAEDVRRALAPRLAAAEAGVGAAFQALLRCWHELDSIAAAMRKVGGAGAGRKHITATQLEMMFRNFVSAAIGKDFSNGLPATPGLPCSEGDETNGSANDPIVARAHVANGGQRPSA
jgi:hypothetical protein